MPGLVVLGGGLLAAVAAMIGSPPQEEPHATLRVVFAGGAAAAMPPGLWWLRSEVLAHRPEWPAGLQADDAFAVHLTPRTLRFLPPLPLPMGTVAAGCVVPAPGIEVTFACDERGREDWFLTGAPHDASLHPLWLALHIEIDGPPRTVDPAALVGHLLGPMVDGDPGRSWLPLAAAQCGEVTFAVRRRDAGLHVRGESAGGLLLPALLLWQAARLSVQPVPRTPGEQLRGAFQLRAFGSRDGDRAEATRQLQRCGTAGIAALRALLHADEPCRLAAIDGLLRLRAAEELPRIIAAAVPHQPLATAMAAAALRELWPVADEATRAATRQALGRSAALGTVALPDDRADRPQQEWRIQVLVLLFLLTTATAGFWWRERCRLAAAADAPAR